MALPFTDTFVGTAGTTLPAHNAGWQDMDNGCIIGVSGEASANPTASTYCFDFWVGDTFNNDQQSSATLKITSVNATCGPMVRAAGTKNCYFLDMNDSGGAASYIFVRGAGGYTLLQNLGTTYANNDVALITIQGTTIKCYKNGVQVGTNQSDSTYSSGSAGLMCLSTTATGGIDSCTVDNFPGGGGGSRGLFLNDQMTGDGVGGAYFRNPLAAPFRAYWVPLSGDGHLPLTAWRPKYFEDGCLPWCLNSYQPDHRRRHVLVHAATSADVDCFLRRRRDVEALRDRQVAA